MNTRLLARRALSLLVAVAFVVPSLPAISPAAAVETPVSLGELHVTTGGRTFKAASASFISTASVVNTSAVTAWVKRIGVVVDRHSVNATLKLNKSKKRLDYKKPVTGYDLNQTVAKTQIINELRSKAPTGTLSTVALKTTVTAGKAKAGKAILVVLSRRKFYVYNNKKIEKSYRCAVGQPRWPTPTGTFRIGKKAKNPSWTNGYASWSKNMPSYIGPSPNNPLGTRALYVYRGSSDTGVRFHGVPSSEDSSIGHAASHGCLRMHRKDVENFFPRVSVGTTVYIIK